MANRGACRTLVRNRVWFFACDDVDLEIRLMGLVARCEGGMRTRDVTA
jgi:hypothetical protein